MPRNETNKLKKKLFVEYNEKQTSGNLLKRKASSEAAEKIQEQYKKLKETYNEIKRDKGKKRNLKSKEVKIDKIVTVS